MRQEMISREIVRMIQRAAGMGAMIIDWDIDYQVGAGIVNGSEKCLWTKSGKRISCTLMPGGGYMISQGKKPDPLYLELERKF